MTTPSIDNKTAYTAPATAEEVRLTACEAINDLTSIQQKLEVAIAGITAELAKGTSPSDRLHLLAARRELKTALGRIDGTLQPIHNAEIFAREAA